MSRAVSQAAAAVRSQQPWHECRLWRPCPGVRYASNVAMTETRFDVLFLNPQLRCPPNPRYGAKLNGFYASPIHHFEGKLWQMRVLRDAQGQHYAFPVIINTGGSAYNMPIFCDSVLKKFLPNFDRVTWHRHTSPYVAFPTPLGDSFNIALTAWDDLRAKEIPEEDEMVYNLIGHELAEVIVACQVIAQLVSDQEFSDDIIDAMIRGAILKPFLHVGAGKDFVIREVNAMVSGMGLPWDTAALPIPDSLFADSE